MSDAPEIQPCPFCGHSANEDCHDSLPFGRVIAVECGQCLAEMSELASDSPGSTEDEILSELIGAWNRRAAPRLSACVEVKPLEWRNKMKGFTTSDGGILSYAIMESRNRVYGIPGDHDSSAEFPTLEDAKAAAQADYEQRIRSALTTRTVEDVRREAFEEAKKAIADLPTGCSEDVMRGQEDAYRAVESLSPAPSRETQPIVQRGLSNSTEGLGRFGHHPDPSIDFTVEVEKLLSRLHQAEHGLSKPGEQPETRAEVLKDAERALCFVVGGDPSAVEAKNLLHNAVNTSTPQPDELRQAKFEAWEQGLRYAWGDDSGEDLGYLLAQNPHTAPDEGGEK